jgi:hypothetical protein
LNFFSAEAESMFQAACECEVGKVGDKANFWSERLDQGQKPKLYWAKSNEVRNGERSKEKR